MLQWHARISQVPDALTVYLTVLAAASNNSVTVVCIGHTTNLLDVLVHPEGRVLLRHKVSRLVVSVSVILKPLFAMP